MYTRYIIICNYNDTVQVNMQHCICLGLGVDGKAVE